MCNGLSKGFVKRLVERKSCVVKWMFGRQNERKIDERNNLHNICNIFNMSSHDGICRRGKDDALFIQTALQLNIRI